MPLKICYHGTNQSRAADILREGFKEGTYFARHLEDALVMGGPHVFGVAFDAAELPPCWQFTARVAIPESRIVHYRAYHVYPMYSNDELQEAVLQSNLAMGQDYCDRED